LDPKTPPSLLSAEPLHGAAFAEAWAGWPSFGIMYGQGITARDDLGGLFSFDYSTTEMRLGAFYRRPLAMAAPWTIGARLGLNWYANFGTHWYYSGNFQDRGLEIAPTLVASAPGAGGIFSIAADLPLTILFWRDGGLIVMPRISGSYETALYSDVTVGVRAGFFYRGGTGDAPMRTGRGGLEVLLTAGYRVF
jgi:hypothetical protein